MLPFKKKIIVICGPTATGKTKLAVKLASLLNSQILSADSRQVYKEMNIGTGKDIPLQQFRVDEELQNKIENEKGKDFTLGTYQISQIPIWLLDIVQPTYKFNVADYVYCANLVLNKLFSKYSRLIPIVVGGTGFYIKGLLEKIDTIGIAPNWKLREKLNNLSTPDLQAMLREISPEKFSSMNQSDIKNPRRLIRAIEIAQSRRFSQQVCNFKYDTLFIGLTAPRSTLYKKIVERVNERIKAGLLEEIQNLLKKYKWENSALGTTLAYKEWKSYFEGKSTYQEALHNWISDEYDYVKRQLTWFKKNKNINWFDITQNFFPYVEKLVKNWYI